MLRNRIDFFFQAEDGIRDWSVTGVQTCALPICDEQSSPSGPHVASAANGDLSISARYGGLVFSFALTGEAPFGRAEIPSICWTFALMWIYLVPLYPLARGDPYSPLVALFTSAQL